MIRLYNSASNQIEEFKPIEEGKVSMYVCGPTVYNHAHIGNARPIIVFDTLRRLFEAQGLEVKYVSNFTDVDDKIINAALAEGVDETVIAERYIEAYNQVRDKLHTEKLSATPRVTETMDEIIQFIQLLVDRGFAYQAANGDVYFSVGAVKEYGSLSKQKLDDLVVGARIEENQDKKNPLDFALWKRTSKGIQWDSPWGKGRPGWHTECVVMIGKEFDSQPIDIHGGGKDLKFPHHENEEAQNLAAYERPLAKTWMHNEMLSFDGAKMSKSLGNVLWAKDVIENLGANVVRWFMLSISYRSILNFTDETLAAAQKELTKVETPLKQAHVKAAMQKKELNGSLDQKLWDRFIEAMDDDLNTPNAYMVIFDAVKLLNQQLRVREINFEEVGTLVYTLEKMLEILGIIFDPVHVSDQDIENYNKWNAAKAEKDFETADVYRKLLMERGLI